MITYKANGNVQANGEDRPKQPALHGVHDLKMTLDLEAHTIVFACDGGDGCEPMKYKGDWEQVRIFCCFGSSDQVITIVSIVGGDGLLASEVVFDRRIGSWYICAGFGCYLRCV